MEHENIGSEQYVVKLLIDEVKRNEAYRKRCLPGPNKVKQWTPILSPLELKAAEPEVAVHLMPPKWHEEIL